MLKAVWDELASRITVRLCHTCALGFVRPIDIANDYVVFACTTEGCHPPSRIRLPKLNRKVIYLDTATVSHIARAARRGVAGEPYRQLRDALVSGVRRDVIACVISPLTLAEVELSRDAEVILDTCRELSSTRTRTEYSIREAQLHRALERFLRGEAPVAEVRPPWQDAFLEDVHAWSPMLSFRSRMPSSPSSISRRRTTRTYLRNEFERVYRGYQEGRLSYGDIVERETAGFCRALMEDGTFHRLVAITEGEAPSRADQERDIQDFIFSDHVRLMPVVVINARLHGELAVRCASRYGRPPRPSDVADIGHLSTYAPYVDVLVTDRFMASLANQGNVNIASEYGAEIRSLGASEIPKFIAWLSALASQSETVWLTNYIYRMIEAGRYLQNLLTWAEAHVREGKNPP